MTLTKIQNEELDSLKSTIEYIEKNIESARINLDIANDLNDVKEINKISKAIEFGESDIKNKVRTMSLSMKLEYNLVLDLIFDREYTLTKI